MHPEKRWVAGAWDVSGGLRRPLRGPGPDPAMLAARGRRRSVWAAQAGGPGHGARQAPVPEVDASALELLPQLIPCPDTCLRFDRVVAGTPPWPAGALSAARRPVDRTQSQAPGLGLC